MSILLLLILFSSHLCAQQLFSEDFLKQVNTLRDKALTNSTAYDITESLTTEVGQRLGGCSVDERAIKWAVSKFKELGFDNIHTEAVTFPKWVGGVGTIKISALGGSLATPKKGIKGEIVHFKTIKDLENTDASLVKGKITFISNHMLRYKNGKQNWQLNIQVILALV